MQYGMTRIMTFLFYLQGYFSHYCKPMKLYHQARQCFVCFWDQSSDVCPNHPLQKKKKKMQSSKLHNRLFLSQKRASTFKDICRPSQLMLLKCHFSLSQESRTKTDAKRKYWVWFSKEKIAAIADTASVIDSITSMNK